MVCNLLMLLVVVEDETVGKCRLKNKHKFMPHLVFFSARSVRRVAGGSGNALWLSYCTIIDVLHIYNISIYNIHIYIHSYIYLQ